MPPSRKEEAGPGDGRGWNYGRYDARRLRPGKGAIITAVVEVVWRTGIDGTGTPRSCTQP